MARTCVAISSVLLLAVTGWAISPALGTACAREALVPLALPVRTNIRVEVVGASVLVGALIIALTFCDLKRAHRWAPAVRSPLRLGIAGEASGHAASRGILPPGPLALLVITVLLVEVIGAGIRVGTLIIAMRLLRELQLACRRRWRGRRRRWRRRRRPCAHVTVIPTLPVAVNTPFLGATPGTLAVIGVAAETGTHSAVQTYGVTCTLPAYLWLRGSNGVVAHFCSLFPNPYSLQAYFLLSLSTTWLHILQARPSLVWATSPS